MKIEKNENGNGFVLTNHSGQTLNVDFLEFWDICRAGTQIDTRSEVKEYLAQCPDIDGHDLDRVRAFPILIDKITEQVIQDRINDESGDQIYDAATKCINAHIAELEDKVKWFRLSEDKCISVWYSPDRYDGDQFQMHLEEIGEDGIMGPGCEVLSSDSYATADISFKALFETLSEICDDAEVYDNEAVGSNSDIVAHVAQEIFDAFGMETEHEYADWKPYTLSHAACGRVVDTALSTIRGVGIDAGSGYYGLKSFESCGDRFNLFFEICKLVDEGTNQPYYSIYYAVEFDEGDTLFSDWASTETLDLEALKNSVFEIANTDFSEAIEAVLKPSSSLDAKIHAADDTKRENVPNAHNINIDFLR